MEKRIWNYLKLRIGYLVTLTYCLYHDVPILPAVAIAFLVNLVWIVVLAYVEVWMDDDDDGGFIERVPVYLTRGVI